MKSRKIVSFDVFDTCLVRKCGTPSSFFDVLSYRVFKGIVTEEHRQKFVVERWKAECKACSDDRATIEDIYGQFSYTHPLLCPKEELIQIELDCEMEMLVPVLSVKSMIEDVRKQGIGIIFISDMYLPSHFVGDILQQNGLMKDGDRIYVSCEVGKLKSTGELFKHIKDKEQINFSNWHHFGDNKNSDVIQPCALGIKAHLQQNKYTPYPQQWIQKDCSASFPYPKILAGISKAIFCSEEVTSHTGFVLDIIAPLYCSYIYRIFRHALVNKISTLYFCARDAYQLYRIAQRYTRLFPSIEVKYLQISRKALYDSSESYTINYFRQVGLANSTEKVAIVDTTTSGMTIKFINELLQKYQYQSIEGYYFLLWDDPRKIDIDLSKYHYELSDSYIRANGRYGVMFQHIWIFENFFALNNQKKTIAYDEHGVIMGEDVASQDCIIENQSYWSQLHEKLLVRYADAYIETEVFRYSDQVFERLALPTILSFFTFPQKCYLQALKDFKVFLDGELKHYIPQESFIRLLRTKGKDSMWKRGTQVYNLPEWFVNLRWSKLCR